MSEPGSPVPAAAPYDAVVLAGGAARRMGGRDKVALDVGGRPILDRVLDAVADAATCVVVGPQRPTARPVTWVREEPPGGGPAAALAAALPALGAEWVALLAGDLPFLTSDDVRALRAAAVGHAGAVFVDGERAPQWLAGVWEVAALRRCRWAPGDSLRRHLTALAPALVLPPDRAAAPWLDCDTAQDLQRARGLA